MLCPGCGSELAKNAKACAKCGQPVFIGKEPGGLSPALVKVVIVLLVIILLGGAGFAVFAQPREVEQERFNPQGRDWVPMNFKFAGVRMDFPGEGWRVDYDASARLTIVNDHGAELDVYFIPALAHNPHIHRIDNRPRTFEILHQEQLRLAGWNGDVLYTVVRGEIGGVVVGKRQLYFQRTFVAPNRLEQTYTYLITLTYPIEFANNYGQLFERIVNSIELYEFSK